MACGARKVKLLLGARPDLRTTRSPDEPDRRPRPSPRIAPETSTAARRLLRRAFPGGGAAAGAQPSIDPAAAPAGGGRHPPRARLPPRGLERPGAAHATRSACHTQRMPHAAHATCSACHMRASHMQHAHLPGVAGGMCGAGEERRRRSVRAVGQGSCVEVPACLQAGWRDIQSDQPESTRARRFALSGRSARGEWSARSRGAALL